MGFTCTILPGHWWTKWLEDIFTLHIIVKQCSVKF